MNKNLRLFSLVVLACLMLSACTGLVPGSRISPAAQQATQDAFILQAAQATATTMAMEAEIARLQTQIAAAPVVDPAAITATPETGEEPAAPTATNTQPPTDTPVPPTQTPPPTATVVLPTLAPTATAQPCNAAQFVQDVTIPDGSVITAGYSFSKTWRLRNVGACTWTNLYDLVFTGGDKMGAPDAIDLPGSVAPGQSIDITVDFIAPSKEGSYRSNWKLRDSAGVVFGLGKSNGPFFVDIKVVEPKSNYPLDFVATMCQAEWTSGAGRLDCPGAQDDSRGFVLRLDNPTLESGYIDDEPALFMGPQMINDGVIRGKYPQIRVESGHKFKALIGCARNTSGCDVKIQLDYQIGSGSIQNMATWHEVYDEKFNNVSVSLDSLAGYDVRFILTVLANGSSNNDKVIWLSPRIVKE